MQTRPIVTLYKLIYHFNHATNEADIMVMVAVAFTETARQFRVVDADDARKRGVYTTVVQKRFTSNEPTDEWSRTREDAIAATRARINPERAQALQQLATADARLVCIADIERGQ